MRYIDLEFVGLKEKLSNISKFDFGDEDFPEAFLAFVEYLSAFLQNDPKLSHLEFCIVLAFETIFGSFEIEENEKLLVSEEIRYISKNRDQILRDRQKLTNIIAAVSDTEQDKIFLKACMLRFDKHVYQVASDLCTHGSLRN